jgi:2-aminoadipate transaminase
MARPTTPDTVEALFATGVSDAIDRSPYGSWRSIADADAVPLSFGFPAPALFPESELATAVERVLEENGPAVLQYGTDDYADELEQFVADRASARGIDPDTTAVTLTNGATHAIDTICRAFLDPGDVIAVEDPTFMGALGVFRNHGVELLGVPMTEDGIDVEAFARTLESRAEAGKPLPKLLYTIPNFHNPTGTTLPRESRTRLLALAEEYGVAVLEDDAYGDLRYDGAEEPPLAALDDAGRVLHVGTFSKTIAPGLRIGWVTGPEVAIEAIDTLAAGGTNTFTRSVAGWFCADGHFERRLPMLREAFETRRDTLVDSLDAHMPAGTTWSTPDGGFFTWVHLPEGVDTEAMLEDAAEAGVTYLPGEMFAVDESHSNCLRLSFSYADQDQIDEGVETLAETVRQRL